MKKLLPITDYQLIDLTHTLTSTTPSWNGSCGFECEVKLDYANTDDEVSFRVQQIKMHAGIGTHMDAPAHCIKGGKSISELALQHFIAPCIRIDCSAKAHESYSLGVEDIIEFEQQYGIIPPGCFALVHTGWEKYWSEPERYHNNYQFPCISSNAIAKLLERKIVGVGIDTLSPDRPGDNYPVHQQVLSAGKYIVENVANEMQLPAVGGFTLALPLKIFNGTEAPMRFIGLVPPVI